MSQLPESIDDQLFTLWLIQLLETNGQERQRKSFRTSKLHEEHTVDQLKAFMNSKGIHYRSGAHKDTLRRGILSYYRNIQFTQILMQPQPMQFVIPQNLPQAEPQFPLHFAPAPIVQPLVQETGPQFVQPSVQETRQPPVQETKPQFVQETGQQPVQETRPQFVQHAPEQQQTNYFLQLPGQQFVQQPPQPPEPVQQPQMTNKPAVRRHKDASQEQEPEYKKKAIPKPLRLAVWEKYFPGQMYGTCPCCQKKMCFDSDYDCSHILAEKLGGETCIDNLVPACKTCNRSMGTKNLYEFQNMFISRKATMVDCATQTDAYEITIRLDQLKIVA